MQMDTLGCWGLSMKRKARAMTSHPHGTPGQAEAGEAVVGAKQHPVECEDVEYVHMYEDRVLLLPM